MKNGLRLVFAGTPAFAARHLQALLDQHTHQVVAVYTQPDRRSGRGKKLTPSAVKSLAVSRGVGVFQPESLQASDVHQQLQRHNSDVMVVVAYGLLLPKAVLTIPRYGCINVHASLLPRWRGAAPIQRAIQAGDAETGVTIMQMDEGLDTGPMLATATCDIDNEDNAGTLESKLAVLGPPTLVGVLDDIQKASSSAVQQNDCLATYARKISKAEARIDWGVPADTVARMIRAFNPAPVAYTTLGAERLRIWFAAPVPGASDAPPGTVLSCDNSAIRVACENSILALTKLQLPGGKPMAVGDLLRGRGDQFAIGTRLV